MCHFKCETWNGSVYNIITKWIWAIYIPRNRGIIVIKPYDSKFWIIWNWKIRLNNYRWIFDRSSYLKSVILVKSWLLPSSLKALNFLLTFKYILWAEGRAIIASMIKTIAFNFTFRVAFAPTRIFTKYSGIDYNQRKYDIVLNVYWF